ncbi:MAG: acyl-CoA dehydrogenase protein [Mycobacterium sp.]|nr:acyl-CoA dehydrogenase protein [Mycobacterium sp.]
MDLSLDEVSEAARDAVRAVCAGSSGVASPIRARESEPFGHDPKLWAELCSIGLPGLGVAETLGGGGADLPALVAVAQELGAVLAPVPALEHLVAARLLSAVAPEHPDLAAVVSGELITTVAPRVRDGVALVVPSGALADVVLALDAGELIAVRSNPPMRSLANQGNLPVADRDLATGARTLLLSGDAAREAFDAAHREWLTLVAAWLAGLAGAALQLALRWVKERQQFGVPIGSFQGIQHGLADFPGLIDGASLLAAEAAWSLTTGRRSVTGASGEQLALMAIVFAADTARQVTSRVVQYHGGLGVAEEHDAQLYFRRARAYPLLTGVPRLQLRELGADLVAEGD